MDNSARGFHLPQNLPVDQQVPFCLSVISRLRDEILPLRKKITFCSFRHDPLLEQLKEWREKYEKEKDKSGKLEQENNGLKQEIEKLIKTNNRYQVALFDHGNFHHPNKQDKKAKGGQKGHLDTNREKQEDYKTYGHKRVFAKTCGKCGCSLTRVNSIKKKILLDIVINSEIVKLIIESERQWCINCKIEVVAKDLRTLPFTEYGINTFMMIMILRFKSHASLANISAVIRIGYGLSLSKSDVSNLLKAAVIYLGKKYDELKEAVRKGNVMYNDETGWSVHGQKAWMWIMANDKVTIYVAAESRGKGIFEEMYGNSNAISMHDGYSSYESVTGEEKTAYCWTHVLRFAYEETVIEKKPTALACEIRDRLVTLYQTIRLHTEWTKEQKEKTLRTELDLLIAITATDETSKNIHRRIATQKEGLILALLITPDGTNNLAERELRNMAIKRSISNGSNTYQGMQTTAIIGSVLQTLTRNKEAPFIPTLQTYLKEGMQKKYHQYMHIPYYDS